MSGHTGPSGATNRFGAQPGSLVSNPTGVGSGNSPGEANGGTDTGGAGGSTDRDPSYDDSIADDVHAPT